MINAALEQCAISMLRGMRHTLTNEKRRSRRGRGAEGGEAVKRDVGVKERNKMSLKCLWV